MCLITGEDDKEKEKVEEKEKKTRRQDWEWMKNVSKRKGQPSVGSMIFNSPSRFYSQASNKIKHVTEVYSYVSH